MKKVLMLLSLATLVLTSCVKNENPVSEEQLRVLPGIYIYNNTATQQAISMQQANIALRFAILQAETAKNLEKDVVTVDEMLATTVSDTNKNKIKDVLLGASSKLTMTSEGIYNIAFQSNNVDMDLLARQGTFVIDTKNTLLPYTNSSTAWRVTVGSDTKVITNPGTMSEMTFNIESGFTEIYYDQGSFHIGLRNIVAYVSDKCKSDWSGDFIWRTANSDLNYKGNVAAETYLSGSASGQSFFSLDGSGTNSTRMSYRLENGMYVGSRYLVQGDETCRLESNYDKTVYPSPTMELESKVSKSGSTRTITQLVKYNGFVYEMSFTLNVRD